MATDTYQVKVRPEKVEAVREIAERFSRAGAVLLTEYRGLTVGQLKTLRAALGDADVEYRVVKNTLTLLAARDRGIDGLDELLEGPTAVAFLFGDPVLGAKALSDFAKNHPSLVIKGGLLEGRTMSADEAKDLAAIDALDVSRAKIAGSLTSALTAIVGTLEGAIRQLMYALQNLPPDETRGVASAAPAEAPSEAAAEAPSEAAVEVPSEAAAEVPSEAAADAPSEAEAAPEEASAAPEEAEAASEEAPAADDTTTEEPAAGDES
jgi:large subunit ribosomal protein L10